MPVDFFSSHSVFRVEELEAFYEKMGRPKSGIKPLLAYHVSQRTLINVRRGVYSHPSASATAIASRLTDDAVVSHDGALCFHGLGDDLSATISTTHRVDSFGDSATFYRAVRVTPAELQHEVQRVAIDDIPGRVTSLEKTFVDCFTRLPYAPEPEDLRDMLSKAAPRLDLDKLVSLTVRTDSPLVVSRVGFFLQASIRNVDGPLLARLDRRALPKPDYFRRSDRPNRRSIASRWRLIVPNAWLTWLG